MIVDLSMFSDNGSARLAIATFVNALGTILGGYDDITKALIIFMFADFITGVCVGIKTCKLNSNRAYKGLRKKLVILVIYGCSNLFSEIVGIDFKSIVGLYYISIEFLSILENGAKIGLYAPKKLVKVLEQLKGDDEDDRKGSSD